MGAGTASRAAPDAIVVGGGAIGLSIAEELARRGGRVSLFERRRPGGEASWAAGGMLAADYELDAPGPLRELALRSRALWPSYSERLRADYGMDSRVRESGALVPAEDAAAFAKLRERLSVPGAGRVEWLDGRAAREREPALAPGIAGAAWLRDDKVCENRALLFALQRAMRVRGVTVVSGGPASIWYEQGTVRGVIVAGERHGAAVTVNAAGAWASAMTFEPGGPPAKHPEVRPVRGQMVGLLGAPDALRHVVRWEGGYAIPRGDGRIVAGSTEEPAAGFEKGVTAEGRAHILGGLAAVLPGLRAEAKHAWSGLRPRAEDGLPLLGTIEGVRGYLMAAGHHRNGILLTPVTAAAIADLAEGRRPAVDLAAFSPSRPAAIPPSIVVNGSARPWRPGTTVRRLLSELALERPGVAVALNEEVVRRGDWDRTVISRNDRVEIIHAVGGG